MSESKFPWAALLLVLASAALAIVTVLVAVQEKPNKLATGILQAVTMVLGVVGSFILGRDQSREAAREIVRPHAKSAFRRTANLYGALGRQQRAIASQREALAAVSTGGAGAEKVALAHVMFSLQGLELMVLEQIKTADDAMEDWRDLVPDEVKAIEEQARDRAGDDRGAASG